MQSMQIPFYLSARNPMWSYWLHGIYTFISVTSLKVKRISSLLKTVTKSTKLYHCSSSNSVATPSCRFSSARNLSICSLFACFSVMALPISSSCAFVRTNRSANPSYLAWYSVWSMATWAFSLTHCCISSPLHSVLPEAANAPFPTSVYQRAYP